MKNGPPENPSALNAVRLALRGTSAMLPHLAGLCETVRPIISDQVATAGVFASGRIVVNADWFMALTLNDRVFIMAHELMHLALRTHHRASPGEERRFNIAHDFIINDMLANALGCEVPANGLVMQGARFMSAEAIVATLSAHHEVRYIALDTGPRKSLSGMGEALRAAGLRGQLQITGGLESDCLDEASEREWFPAMAADEAARVAQQINKGIDQAVALGRLRQAMAFPGSTSQPETRGYVDALASTYRPSWELALQRWVDDTVLRSRSYLRASRRQGSRQDVVLPGTKRDGLIVTLVLDTSGSMSNALPHLLDIIAGFCLAAQVNTVRILQCDTQVTVDEYIAPDDLSRYEVRGGGGSDMSPGLLCLAADPSVEAAIVLSDGEIIYPGDPLPYDVLWGILEPVPNGFTPAYGRIMPIPR